MSTQTALRTISFELFSELCARAVDEGHPVASALNAPKFLELHIQEKDKELEALRTKLADQDIAKEKLFHALSAMVNHSEAHGQVIPGVLSLLQNTNK